MGKMIKVQMGFQDSSLRDDRTVETGSGAMFTIGELRNFLRKETDISPSDLFTKEKIADDSQVIKCIEQQVDLELNYRERTKKEKDIETEKKKSLIPGL